MSKSSSTTNNYRFVALIKFHNCITFGFTVMVFEFYDQTFTKENLDIQNLGKQYELCHFEACNLEGANLSKIAFIDCTFSHCNLSLATLEGTAFKGVNFQDCKLMGLRWDRCDPFLFEINAQKSVFNLSVFYKMKMTKLNMAECSFKEVDFGEADLSESVFIDCDFLAANFDNGNLKKADFRSAYNFTIDPEITQISKARFSKENIIGLLSKYKIRID